jgi:acylglycerol lipase
MYIPGHKDISLHYVSWMPENGARAILMLIHDLGDHVQRFQHLATYFNSKNIGVVGIDLRGHGKSGGRRGNSRYEELLRDVNELVKHTQHAYPYIPKLVYGHSMGGNLAMNFTIKFKPAIQGVIAASPWLEPPGYPNSLFLLSAKLLKLDSLITIPNNINSRHLSHDFKIVSKYEEDRLVHHRVSPRLILETNEAGTFILRNKHKFNLPLLLMHGSSDMITPWKSSAGFAKYTSSNTTFKLWEGAYHELHNEFDKEKFFAYILNWINNLSSVQHAIYGNF